MQHAAAQPGDGQSSFAQDRTALGLARIEAHYFANGLFLPPEGLLGGMDGIGRIPAEIVQGRYDMICPARTAFELAAAWPCGAADDRAGRRAFGAGARHPARAGGGGGAVRHGRNIPPPCGRGRTRVPLTKKELFAMKVGVIGLGTMGMGAALNLVRKGHQVIGCDVREAARAELAAAGGSGRRDAPPNCRRALEAVVVFVVNAAQTEDVLFGAQRLSREAARRAR